MKSTSATPGLAILSPAYLKHRRPVRPPSGAGVLKPQPPQVWDWPVCIGVDCLLPFQFKQKNRSARQTQGQSCGSFSPIRQQAVVYRRETGLPSGTFIWFLWLILGTHLPLCHFLRIKQFLRKGTHSLKYIVWLGV